MIVVEYLVQLFLESEVRGVEEVRKHGLDLGGGVVELLLVEARINILR